MLSFFILLRLLFLESEKIQNEDEIFVKKLHREFVEKFLILSQKENSIRYNL